MRIQITLDIDPQDIGLLLEEYSTLSNLLHRQLEQILLFDIANSSSSEAPGPPDERTRRIIVTKSILGAAIIRLHGPTIVNGSNEASARRTHAAKTILGALIDAGGRYSSSDVTGRAGWLNPIIGVSIGHVPARTLLTETCTIQL